jgi:hypothetical protein
MIGFKMNSKLFFLLIVLLSFNIMASEPETKSRLELEKSVKSAVTNKPIISPDKYTPLIFSALVPGSGQIYFGHELKGVLFTVGFFSSAVTSMLSHNNMVGRDDQIKKFTKEYLASQEFVVSEKLWRNIEEAKAKRDADYSRRNIFIGVAAGIWLANIVDVLFFTENIGKDEFGMNSSKMDLKMTSAGPNIEIKFFLP